MKMYSTEMSDEVFFQWSEKPAAVVQEMKGGGDDRKSGAESRNLNV